MGPGLFIIAILGCGEGETACTEVTQAPVRYESQAACVDATEAAMMEHSDIPYPVVVAQCRAAADAAGRVFPTEVKLPEPKRATPRNVIAARAARRS
jgi:hypothetical protein